MDISQDLGGGLKGKKVLDPCCGTGNFLIQFSDDVDICNIHAFDTDMLSGSGHHRLGKMKHTGKR